jgi:hypothetical protein
VFLVSGGSDVCQEGQWLGGESWRGVLYLPGTIIIMAKPSVPTEIQVQVKASVEKYNQSHSTQYKVSFRGKYCYLSRLDNRNNKANAMLLALKRMGVSADKLINNAPAVETQIGRLEWTGDIGKWGFAVYKYSRDSYDPDEWMFPGSKLLDGTIEGAMRAGHEIYP